MLIESEAVAAAAKGSASHQRDRSAPEREIVVLPWKCVTFACIYKRDDKQAVRALDPLVCVKEITHALTVDFRSRLVLQFGSECHEGVDLRVQSPLEVTRIAEDKAANDAVTLVRAVPLAHGSR
ncbi:hypothetical protein CCR75_007075 [Bremia lactucae]|uniref:Uncharacterized protein n=1 Tax=Bremia lactucae TaxID=4779 RepID=A0A976ICB1_BRELC|nr:hypothetical protein CCR75_007075 [Bremia lactucae]